ncbi:MAG: hypothetical protein GX767_01595, partial [Firmicutes bacterium]|nr:hypothetical protein [Bacillota bacterium]
MAGSNPIIISIFILYCIIVFTIGLWAKKSTNTMAEFFVSKRDFGVLATGVTYYATAQSSSAFLGMVGWAYAFGWASSNYVSVPIAVGGFLTWALLSWRIKDLSSKIQGLTVPDLIYWRFPMKSVRLVALLIIIIAYIPMMTAQIRGVGFLFQSIISDISFGWAAFIGTVIVLIYVMLGGMKAAAYTSVLQGFFMIFSVVVLTVASLSAVGGFTEMNLQAAAIDPGYTGLTGVGGSWGPMYSLSFILLFLLSPLGQPAYLAKFFAMKDLNVARLAMPISYTFVLIASFAFPIIGLCARILYPDLPNPDAAYTVITTSLLHPVLAGIVLVSLFAAVMSTIDAILLTITSAFVRDLYEQVLGKTPGSKTLLRTSVVVT